VTGEQNRYADSTKEEEEGNNNNAAMDAADGDASSYKELAERAKDEGNALFQAGKTEEAILLYNQAIDLDPDNHLYYSNRSAAHMKNDSKSKALHDAEKCVALAPTWPKGYARLGAAQQALKRFDAAVDTFKKGLELDATNQALWSALRACQEAHETDKKSRFAEAAKEREREAQRLRRADEQKAAAAAAALAAAGGDEELAGFFSDLPAAAATAAEGKSEEEELLSGFFSEVLVPPTTTSASSASSSSSAPSSSSSSATERDESVATEKYASQDLGEARAQYERIMAKNYEWRNLNPYFVLQLDIDATEEDIKQRYRKMAAKLHPDKMRDVEDARECFEQVKTAYQKLCDEKEKKVVVMNIEHVKGELAKERRRALAKGTAESDLPPLEEEEARRLMKHFAEMEMLRRRSEKNLRAYSAREKMQEKEQQQKVRRSRAVFLLVFLFLCLVTRISHTHPPPSCPAAH
jgi:tetratricopeptide (TPR) repeat protein